VNAKTAVVMDALGIVPATPAPESDADPTPAKPAPSFDGGARTPAPLAPESHAETLLRILSERRADAGVWFGG
jgi:hypothetical protein